MKYFYHDLIVLLFIVVIIVSFVLLRYWGGKSKNEASEPAENLNSFVRPEDKNNDIKKTKQVNYKKMNDSGN